MTFRLRCMTKDSFVLTYMGIFVVALFVHLMTQGILQLTTNNSIIIDEQEFPTHVVDERYLSFGIDTVEIAVSVDNLRLDSKRLQNLTSLLGPAYIRLGGTMSDRLIFTEESVDANVPMSLYRRVKECINDDKECPKKFLPYFTMNGEDLIKINDFCKKTNSKLLFDLNALFRNGSEWDYTNAEQLLRFAYDNNIYHNIDWQLGNEPNSFRHVFNITVPPEQLAQDFKTLKSLINQYSPGSKLIGPDTTRPQPKRPDCVKYMKNFLEGLIEPDDLVNPEPHNVSDYIDAVAWHQYYLNGRTASLPDFWLPETLSLLNKQIKTMRDNIDDLRMGTPMWLTETSSAYGGGAPNLSNSFAATALWLDKLGLAAKNDITVVIRQSLTGAHYCLIDKDLTPLPDWWISLLYKRLVGREVISCKLEGTNSQRVYCHCSSKYIRTKGNSITVYGINLDSKSTNFQLEGTAFGDDTEIDEYVLTSPTDRKSKKIQLNGEELVYDDDLPKIVPNKLNHVSKLRMPGYSLAFWVIHNVNISFCG